ncbi:alpha/beta hydrolase [Ktedonobacter racemifer]|uniref:Esterase/lipase n=1 Tax=Ktedonobacter racemifer DSM 44963 TaxID=485913 RepID=D6TME4_KTERA|nr:alpha/beta fold hydrolase [Ktedonobacter racemifer]EFH86944.1 esterase/lipase [Ktedonobacter racemifer DSM 44963]
MEHAEFRDQQDESELTIKGPERARVGVVLVHGLNGNRSDMEELEQLFLAQGMRIENILLPGHGTQVQDMLTIGWHDWASALQQAVRAFKLHCDQVFLVGHSLGGALCLHIAAHEEVSGVIAMCAPLYMRPWMLPAIRMVRQLTPFLPTLREDLRDAQARKHYTRNVYRWTPMAPVESMLLYLPRLREELPCITMPALIIAAQRDHVVPVRDGHEIYRLLGSPEKQLVVLKRSYHLVMKDYDRQEVEERSLAFIQKYTHKETKTEDRRTYRA